jgi:hypothetical protein
LLGLCEGKSNEIIALPKPEPKGQHAPAPAKAADPVAEVVAEAEAPAAEVVAEAEEAPVVEEATA